MPWYKKSSSRTSSRKTSSAAQTAAVRELGRIARGGKAAPKKRKTWSRG